MVKNTLYKIVPDSIVKGTGSGYMVCQTDPIHPKSIKLKDHKCRYIYVHRVVMENKLGRPLSDEEFEQVDHKDKDKSNNSPSNLELNLRGPHQKSHTERGNHFWKTSPANKKNTTKNRKKAASIIEAAQRVVLRFLQV